MQQAAIFRPILTKNKGGILSSTIVIIIHNYNRPTNMLMFSSLPLGSLPLGSLPLGSLPPGRAGVAGLAGVDGPPGRPHLLPAHLPGGRA